MLIDALQCGHFDGEVLREMAAAGFTCVTNTLGFWEGTLESLDAIGRWRDLERDNADAMVIARTSADIHRADESGRLAVLMGFQNSNLLEGRIAYVELFAELGVRVIQLTYNNQNELGGSCYEDEDSGLSRFGREVVREMNRTGIVVDCSHVGDRTTLDAIKWAQKPLAITHANAASLFPHKRNKSDAVLAALKDNAGVIGCAAYRNITPEAACASLAGWCEMIARTVDLVGIDHVGIGTDFSHHNSQSYLDWMRKGRWTRSVQYGAGSAARPGPAPKPDWLTRIGELARVRDGLAEAGFDAAEVEKLAAGNWLRLYGEVFG